VRTTADTEQSRYVVVDDGFCTTTPPSTWRAA